MSYNATFAAKRDPPHQGKTRGFDMQRQEKKNQFHPLKFYGQFMSDTLKILPYFNISLKC